MKRGMHLLLALGLAFSCIGCAGETKKDDTTTPDTSAAGSADTSATAVADASTSSTETPPVTGDFTLVNLKVPNMT